MTGAFGAFWRGITSGAFPWILVIVFGVFLMRSCGEADPAIPPELRAELDAFRAAKPKSDSIIRLNAKLVDSVDAIAARLRLSTRPERVAATAQGITADSAAKLAQKAETARDSAVAWEAAYVARSAQAAALESVVARLDSAAIQDSIGKVALARALSETSTRLATAEVLIDDLEEAAEKRDQCKVLGFIKCPTRTMAFVAGSAVTGAIIVGLRLYP